MITYAASKSSGSISCIRGIKASSNSLSLLKPKISTPDSNIFSSKRFTKERGENHTKILFKQIVKVKALRKALKIYLTSKQAFLKKSGRPMHSNASYLLALLCQLVKFLTIGAPINQPIRLHRLIIETIAYILRRSVL